MVVELEDVREELEVEEEEHREDGDGVVEVEARPRVVERKQPSEVEAVGDAVD